MEPECELVDEHEQLGEIYDEALGQAVVHGQHALEERPQSAKSRPAKFVGLSPWLINFMF